MRLALANLRYPATPAESVTLAAHAIAEAGAAGAQIICFPECYIPGYRWPGRNIPPPDAKFLESAYTAIATAAARARIAVILGTERFAADTLLISAMVFNPDGTLAGIQDKVQLDPSEDALFTPGSGRQIFQLGDMTFGIAICHEGFRYPETVRWAARHGAQVVFHPHFDEAAPGADQPTQFADPTNTFHEKAILCRAAENTCYVATVNCAHPAGPTTSAVVRPDGTLLCHQPYGKEGLLLADIDLTLATRQLALRCKTSEYST